MKNHRTVNGSRRGERDDSPVEWTVLKSVQEANAASTRAMEELLLVGVGPAGLGDPDRAAALLERCVDHHERAIDQLELALERVDEGQFGD